MTTSEDIAIMIRELLVDAAISGVTVEWQRHGYETTKEIVIVPHYADGEGSLRSAVVMVNIHCPDIFNGQAYETDMASLISLKKSVILVLKNHVWIGTGINIEVNGLNPPIKEEGHNEHYASLRILAHIRES